MGIHFGFEVQQVTQNICGTEGSVNSSRFAVDRFLVKKRFYPMHLIVSLPRLDVLTLLFAADSSSRTGLVEIGRGE